MYLCVVVVSVSIFVPANVSANDELPAVFRDQGFITQQGGSLHCSQTSGLKRSQDCAEQCDFITCTHSEVYGLWAVWSPRALSNKFNVML